MLLQFALASCAVRREHRDGRQSRSWKSEVHHLACRPTVFERPVSRPMRSLQECKADEEDVIPQVQLYHDGLRVVVVFAQAIPW